MLLGSGAFGKVRKCIHLKKGEREIGQDNSSDCSTEPDSPMKRRTKINEPRT